LRELIKAAVGSGERCKDFIVFGVQEGAQTVLCLVFRKAACLVALNCLALADRDGWKLETEV
jgi:hypothetical protein